ncbi:hypothetical protein MRX96_015676 [Rhipicephalus microplus]
MAVCVRVSPRPERRRRRLSPTRVARDDRMGGVQKLDACVDGQTDGVDDLFEERENRDGAKENVEKKTEEVRARGGE